MSEYEVPLFILCYDGVTDPPADPPADPLATPPATPPAPDAKFTQNDLNKILAEERRKADAKVKSLLGEKQVHIDKLLEMKNLTEQERAALQTEKEELQRQLLTKEERLKAEKKAVEDTLNAKVKEIETKATAWEQRYVASSIKRELQDAAVKGDAFNPGQLVAMLKPMTTMEPVKDASGNPTDELAPVVTIEKDGKPTQFTPEQAIAYMKTVPAQYGNLFKAKSVPGVGANSQPAMLPGSGEIDWNNLSQAQYEALRGKNPALPAGKGRR